MPSEFFDFSPVFVTFRNETSNSQTYYKPIPIPFTYTKACI